MRLLQTPHSARSPWTRFRPPCKQKRVERESQPGTAGMEDSEQHIDGSRENQGRTGSQVAGAHLTPTVSDMTMQQWWPMQPWFCRRFSPSMSSFGLPRSHPVKGPDAPRRANVRSDDGSIEESRGRHNIRHRQFRGLRRDELSREESPFFFSPRDSIKQLSPRCGPHGRPRCRPGSTS
jgi:hypothetical protein